MRKLNVRWLVGIVVCPIVFGILAYFLHSFQMGRNAKVFVREAKRAQAEGHFDEAAVHLRRYVKLAPQDTEGLILYGNQLADLNNPGAAYLSLEKAIQRVPDRSDVRKRLVELSLKLGRNEEARDNLENYLLKESPNDSELLDMLATAQIQQSKFTEAQKSLESAIQNAPDRIPTYVRLASVLKDKLNQPAEAETAIQDMVSRNPETPRAYIFRADWRLRELSQYMTPKQGPAPKEDDETVVRLRNEIDADIKQALTIAPEDSESLIVAIRVAQFFGRNEEVRSLIDRGIKHHANEIQFYVALADSELTLGNLKASADALRKAVSIAPKNLDLKWNLANRLVELEEDASVKELLEQLKTGRYPQPLIDYIDARSYVRRKDWPKAVGKLETLRFDLRERPLLEKQVDYWLGVAYRETNEPDQSLTAFRRAEAIDPNWKQARMAVAEALANSNQPSEAVAEFRQIATQPDAPASALIGLERSLLQANMRRPANQRNWTEFEAVMKKLEQMDSESTQVVMLKTQRLAVEGKRNEAENLIRSALEKTPDQMDLWTMLFEIAQATGDAEQIDQVVANVEKQFGDTPALRRLKARLVAQRNPLDKARELLRPLSKAPSDWPEQQKLQLASEFALFFFVAGDVEEAERLANIVATAMPKNLQNQILLLDIGIRSKNLKLIEKVLGEILVNTGEGAIWHYGKARLLTLQGDESKDEQKYVQAKSHLERAAVIRPTWDRVHTMEGEVLEKQNDFAGATEQYLKAIELGETSTAVINRALMLLIRAKRYEDADRLIRTLHDSQVSFTTEMAQTEVDLMLQFGRREQALKAVDRMAADKDRQVDPMWMGRVYQLLEKFDEAETQYRAALKANPKQPNTWLALIQTLVRSKQKEQAAAAIEEARKSIDGELGLVVAGQGYEILGNPEQAKIAYQEALDKFPGSVDMRRRWIDFLLRMNAPAQAEVVIRELLEEGPDASEAQKNARPWAQNRLIDALRMQGTREKVTEALRLVNEQISRSKTESIEDLRKKAQILAMFSNREDRQKAVDILDKLVDQEPILANQLEERWLLANLYQALGEPAKSRAELRQIIATRKDDTRALVAYIEQSIQAKEFSEAELYLNSLKKLAPDESTTAEVEIGLLYKRKKYDEIANLLKTIDSRKVDSQDPELADKRQNWVARWFSTITSKLTQDDQLDESERFNAEAEKFYKKLVEKKPSEVMAYAEFLSATPQIDRCLELLKEHRNELSWMQFQRIVRGVMKNPRTTPEQLSVLQEQVNTREPKPRESTPLALLAADLMSWRGDFKGSIQKYTEVLQREKENVVALNNLAFVLALSSSDLTEAMRYITQAITIGGPMDALYDTRGFIHLVGGNSEAAAADFEKSILENENAERRVHSAMAYAQLKNWDASRKALKRADEIRIVQQEMHPVEREMLANLRRELEKPENQK